MGTENRLSYMPEDGHQRKELLLELEAVINEPGGIENPQLKQALENLHEHQRILLAQALSIIRRGIRLLHQIDQRKAAALVPLVLKLDVSTEAEQKSTLEEIPNLVRPRT